jgi:hypothetical protein
MWPISGLWALVLIVGAATVAAHLLNLPQISTINVGKEVGSFVLYDEGRYYSECNEVTSPDSEIAIHFERTIEGHGRIFSEASVISVVSWTMTSAPPGGAPSSAGCVYDCAINRMLAHPALASDAWRDSMLRRDDVYKLSEISDRVLVAMLKAGTGSASESVVLWRAVEYSLIKVVRRFGVVPVIALLICIYITHRRLSLKIRRHAAQACLTCGYPAVEWLDGAVCPECGSRISTQLAFNDAT